MKIDKEMLEEIDKLIKKAEKNQETGENLADRAYIVWT